VSSVHIGTAGWSIARDAAERFPAEGSGLERYAAVFDAVEINSSFHRPHRTSTWERWRDSVPDNFRFSVKIPKHITHELRLVGCDEAIDAFVGEAGVLGGKLAVWLVQLPPSLALDAEVAARFFARLAERSQTAIACEPRHASWFSSEAEELLTACRVARVAADPARHDGADKPGGWKGLQYWRLHGSPVIYRSSYKDRIDGYADALRSGSASGAHTWCVFDNTASSAATRDALSMNDRLARSPFPVD